MTEAAPSSACQREAIAKLGTAYPGWKCAADLCLSLTVLNALQRSGMVEHQASGMARRFPRTCIWWRLTRGGLQIFNNLPLS